MSTFYSINDLSMISGLTDRTIRSHIAKGILHGEMIEHAWTFTREEITAYLDHPLVKRSVQCHKNAVISDFVMDQYKTSEQICLVWDLPGHDAMSIISFFNQTLRNDSSLHDFNFSFEPMAQQCRIILKGPAEDILRLSVLFSQSNKR